MSSELTRRVVFGVIAAPIAIAIVVYGGAPLAALLAVTSALAAWELFRLARATGLTPFDDIGIVIAGVTPLVVHARFLRLYDPDAFIGPTSLAVLCLLLLLAIAIWTRGPTGKPLDPLPPRRLALRTPVARCRTPMRSDTTTMRSRQAHYRSADGRSPWRRAVCCCYSRYC